MASVLARDHVGSVFGMGIPGKDEPVTRADVFGETCWDVIGHHPRAITLELRVRQIPPG